jgi:hypothetical protein
VAVIAFLAHRWEAVPTGKTMRHLGSARPPVALHHLADTTDFPIGTPSAPASPPDRRHRSGSSCGKGHGKRQEQPLWNFTVLGEHAALVRRDRGALPRGPWRNPVRLRTRVVHGYWSIE